jgi:hypothetical protein
MKIRNRKHVIIYSDVLAQGTLVDINVDINNVTFLPDEVNIKSAYLNDNLDGSCYRMYTNMIQNTDGFFLMQDTQNGLKMYDISHPISSPIQGRYRFYLVNPQNQIHTSTSNNGCYFYIHLEFIEYWK